LAHRRPPLAGHAEGGPHRVRERRVVGRGAGAGVRTVTPIDYAALAERLEAHAECHANVEPFDDEQRQWADDLRTVVTLLRGIAEAKPFAWAVRDGWGPTRFSIDPDTPIVGMRRADHVVDPLYLHPA